MKSGVEWSGESRSGVDMRGSIREKWIGEERRGVEQGRQERRGEEWSKKERSG